MKRNTTKKEKPQENQNHNPEQRLRFFWQLLQLPLTTLGRNRRTHAHRSDAAQTFNYLG
jgi:hypothetical protein